MEDFFWEKIQGTYKAIIFLRFCLCVSGFHLFAHSSIVSFGSLRGCIVFDLLRDTLEVWNGTDFDYPRFFMLPGKDSSAAFPDELESVVGLILLGVE